jgi:hypothetical protein
MSKLTVFIIAVLIGGIVLSLFLLFRLIKKKVSLKRAFSLVLLYGVLSLVVLYPYRSRIRGYFHRFQREVELRHEPEANCDCTSLEVPKDDYADLHRPLAIRLTKNGFIKDEATLNDFLRRKRLVSVGDGDGYYIQYLSSSSKHLTPIAKKRLEELAILFRSFLKNTQNEKDYFVVSSITRTEKQQEEICQKYPNSCTRGTSAHSFGVSFDINRIKSFGDCAVSRQAFIKALNQMRDEKKILLCPEFKCIHVTVIN